MSIIEPIRDRDERIVPAIIARFVSANQENGRAERVERIERSQRFSRTLRTQFPHMAMAGTVHCRTVWKSQSGTKFREESDGISDVVLLVFCQYLPPSTEFWCEFNVPGQYLIMP